MNCKIPVVILTTSEAEEDVARAYDHHANSYLIKPVDFVKFTQLMDELGFTGWRGIIIPGHKIERCQ